MKRRWGFVRELLGFVGVMTGLLLLTQPTTVPGTMVEALLVVALILVGWWEFALRFLWLNWVESPELTCDFSSERIDRPVPFTFRCSEMRFYSTLSPEELPLAMEREITVANEELDSWHIEEKTPVSWKAEWKLHWKGGHVRLKCFRSAKTRWAWERVHGAVFLGRLVPCEDGGCFLQGHFGWSLPALLLFPAIWWAPGWFGLFGGEPGAVLGMAPFALYVLLKDLGRGSYGVDELTIETQKALIGFFGEPELLE